MTDTEDQKDKDVEAIEEFVDRASENTDDPLELARKRYEVCTQNANKATPEDGVNLFQEVCPNMRIVNPSKETVFEGRVRLTLQCKECGIKEVVLAKFWDGEDHHDATEEALERMAKIRSERAKGEDDVEEFFRRARGDG